MNLAIDEAPLTGESTTIHKTHAELADATLGIGDRHNMAFAGTVVTCGRGQGIAVATGMATEFGRISGLVQPVDAGRTPLQQNLDRLGRTLGKIALAVVALIVGLGLWRGLPLLDMLIFGVALAVAVVPEALPAVVTISLAIGVQRMAKRNALVRRLAVVETLGSTSVICSDKTGTLTKNEMTVRRLSAAGRTISVSGAGYEPVGQFLEGQRTLGSSRRNWSSSGPVFLRPTRHCDRERENRGSKVIRPRVRWSLLQPRQGSIRHPWITSFLASGKFPSARNAGG
jgi:Ca2+-transporting ATPase